jgi:hypothetical protein
LTLNGVEARDALAPDDTAKEIAWFTNIRSVAVASA